jgi:hypothetical protein
VQPAGSSGVQQARNPGRAGTAHDRGLGV